MNTTRLVILLIILSSSCLCQNVGINTTGVAPNSSAMLDVAATNKGMLIPRLALSSNTDAATITTPATSLLIYNTATAGFAPNNITPGYYYNSGTTAAPVWQRLLTSVNTTSNAWLITGNSGTINGTHFIGTTDNIPLNFRVNNVQAGRVVSTGATFFGYQAGLSNTALLNTGIGSRSLFSVTSGNNNTAVGRSSLYFTTIGTNNTAVGVESLYSNTTGGLNTALGYNSLYSNTTGIANTASGSRSLYSNTTGDDNTTMGNRALESNISGSYNTAFGDYSLNDNTTADYNVAIGKSAMQYNTIGELNTSAGALSMFANTTGSFSAAFGGYALYQNTTGNYNVANGYESMRTNTTGSYNSSTGNAAMYSNSTGNYNASLGNAAMYSNTTGSYNTSVGGFALSNNTTGSNNTAIGYDAGVSNTGFTNATAIGSNATVNASNRVRIGDAAVTTIVGQVAYTFPSDARFKEKIKDDVLGLDFILKLRPVSYNFNRLSFAKHIREKTEGRENELTELSKNRSVGFLAQDIEQLIKETGFESFDAVHPPTNETDNYSLSYSHFVIPLVKAVQEQQAIINQQNQAIKDLLKRIEKLENN